MKTYQYLNDINKYAIELNEHIRLYSNMRDMDKMMVVSACLLTIHFSDIIFFDTLTGDTNISDGEKIYSFLETELSKRLSNKKSLQTIMSSFLCLKNIDAINTVHSKLDETPIKYFLRYLDEQLVAFCREHQLNTDYLGVFYNQFMRYSGSDKQNLGTIITPSFVLDLISDLVDLKPTDIILDPCCGTGGFLISSLLKLLNNGAAESVICNSLYGFDIQPQMFTITVTNLILRQCNTDHICCLNFMELPSSQIRESVKATVGFMNPPYAQGKKDVSLNEICYVSHLLDSLTDGAKCAVVVPASTFVMSKQTDHYKLHIYQHHTLEGVITLNPNTFYGVASMPIIAIFTAHRPHPENKLCKFINFKDDGFVNHPHIGRTYTTEADSRKEYLLNVWNGKEEADTDFCINTMIKSDDEWLYNFYHSNLNIPEADVFDSAVNKYLTFHYRMVLNGRADLFEHEPAKGTPIQLESLNEKKWAVFQLGETFIISGAKITNEKLLVPGNHLPRVTTSMFDNAYEGFYSDTLLTGRPAHVNPGKVVTIETATKGTSFYQPYNFISNPHVITLQFKNHEMNQYSGLFLSACISNAIDSKYYYGYKFSKFRILREKIVLPIKDDGEIDYDYMEQYIRNLFIQKNTLADNYKF